MHEIGNVDQLIEALEELLLDQKWAEVLAYSATKKIKAFEIPPCGLGFFTSTR